ncbi:ATP-dependent DNA helicase [Sphingobacterium sp. JB170]|nr:ATP-dependent DNA helicase [Sphingobacterium sp. JB170]
MRQNQLDSIQKKIIELGHKVSPNYFPIVQPYVLQDKHVLVLWCIAGDNRPYTAPVSLGSDGKRQPYIRLGATTVIAKGENLRRLHELTARIPFDDRMNNQASIQDFDLGLIQAYLQEVKSSLYAESLRMSLSDISRAMYIAKGPDEDLRPLNVGLLFFSKEPERFFSRPWIEVVWHESTSGRKFKEFYFKGPLHKQLRDALSFLKTNIIAEQIVKRPDRAEADRFYNFPYEAVEETLANAVYHKSYALGAPIEVQIWHDKIEVLSLPGPVPPVNAVTLKNQRRIVARENRNRRIGDFLKELHLTEGRGTGFPTIYDAMENNGSPAPIFETDDQTYVLVTLATHELFQTSVQENDQVGDQDNSLYISTLVDLMAFVNQAANQVTNQATNQALAVLDKEVHGRVLDILAETVNWVKREDIFKHMELSNQTFNRKKFLDPLIDIGWIQLAYPDTRTHPNQRYKITDTGRRLLNIINK